MGRTKITIGIFAMLAAASIGLARQEADPAKDYHVTPEVGPWMICAASYMGEKAPKMAHDLVLELRRDYDLPAFVYNRGDIERRKMQEEMDQKRRQQEEALHQQGLQPGRFRGRHVRIEDQCAVLIGGYKDMDTAHSVLEKIKKLPNPKSVPADELILAPKDSGQLLGAKANIFTGGFVTRNPTVSQEKVERGLDPVTLKQLNADESYSLLKCKQPWTLAVKEFSGGVAIQPAAAPTTFLEKLLGNKTEEHMSAIGKQAHELARVLKQMGFDAFVLHTTTSSIVTVGAYADPEDDKLHQAQKQLRNMQFGWIQLASNPLPMPVPRP